MIESNGLETEGKPDQTFPTPRSSDATGVEFAVEALSDTSAINRQADRPLPLPFLESPTPSAPDLATPSAAEKTDSSRWQRDRVVNWSPLCEGHNPDIALKYDDPLLPIDPQQRALCVAISQRETQICQTIKYAQTGLEKLLQTSVGFDFAKSMGPKPPVLVNIDDALRGNSGERFVPVAIAGFSAYLLIPDSGYALTPKFFVSHLTVKGHYEMFWAGSFEAIVKNAPHNRTISVEVEEKLASRKDLVPAQNLVRTKEWFASSELKRLRQHELRTSVHAAMEVQHQWSGGVVKLCELSPLEFAEDRDERVDGAIEATIVVSSDYQYIHPLLRQTHGAFVIEADYQKNRRTVFECQSQIEGTEVHVGAPNPPDCSFVVPGRQTLAELRINLQAFAEKIGVASNDFLLARYEATRGWTA